MKGKPSRPVHFGKPRRIYSGIIIIVIVLICILYFINQRSQFSGRKIDSLESRNMYLFHEMRQSNMRDNDPPFEGKKIVHLDLKGAPPKISYFRKLFPLLSELGADGILIEYEDMFPYSGSELGNISAHNAYSLQDVYLINMLAKESHLEVIPLVQTFGHLEFLLKLSEFKEFREVPAYPSAICPTHDRTLSILVQMVDQMIESHPNSNIIHIGADEVYYLGVCDRCLRTIAKYSMSKNSLFLEHIKTLIESIHRKHPNVQILMWDDEFRSITLRELKKSHIATKVQPVVWKYTKDVYDDLGPTLWDTYAEIFPKLWIASAFKGATGSNHFVTDATHYLQNHRSWLSVVAEHRDHIHFEGIIITGWQRYDHFAILCELLPVGLPSLAMSLRLLLGYNDSPLSPPTEVAKILGCEQPYALIGSVFGFPKCSFPGGAILENVLHLQQLIQEYETIMENSKVRGWMSEYNIAHVFSSPQYVEAGTEALDKIKSDLQQIETDIVAAMDEIYDNYTIDEWVETYIKPFKNKINSLRDAKDLMLAKDSWPRRPLQVSRNEF